MGWDGSGGYDRQRNFSGDASANIKILASAMDQELDDFASAMQLCLARDGQNTPTGDIPMGGNRVINVGAAQSATDYIRAKEVIENVPVYMVDENASSDRVSVSSLYFTGVSAAQAPADGVRILVKANSDKSSAALYLDGYSANIEYQGGGVIGAAMVSGGIYGMVYSSSDTAWKLESPTDGRTAKETAAGVTPSNYQYPEGDIRRYGGTGDGTTDDSAALQAVLTIGNINAYIPYGASGVYLVDSTTITVASGTRLTVDPGVTIRRDSDGSDIGWIRFVDVSDCDIRGGVWEYQTKPAADEQRHIFDIRGATDIVIRDTQAVKAGGDGYYIGSGAVNDFCTRVRLENVVADNCRRQGISIVSVKSCRVKDAHCINITGTNPQAGIDIEPNGNDDYIEDVVISNLYTENTTGAGLKIDLRNLPGATAQEVSITVNGHTDANNASNTSLLISKLDLDGNTVAGSIQINDLKSINAYNSGIIVQNYDALGPRIDIVRPVIINPNQVGSASVSLGSAILLYAAASDTGATNVGNISITNPRIDDNDGNVTNYFYVRDVRSVGSDEMLNVNIYGRIDAEGQGTPLSMIDWYSTGIIEDVGEVLTHNATAGFTLQADNYVRKVTNSGAGGTVEVELDTNLNFSAGTRITFEVVTDGQILRIDPEPNARIQPGGEANGDYVQADQVGDRITIEKVSDTEWKVLNEVKDGGGEWTRQS